MARYREMYRNPQKATFAISSTIFLAAVGLMTATKMLDAIEEAIAGLADMPQKCPPVYGRTVDVDGLSQASSEELHCFLHNRREVKGR